MLQLSASANTREFAPGHARSLIKRQLAEESSTYFHGLALKLAAAEAEVAALRGNAVHAEHLQIKTTQVNAEIQELRQEYQVRRCDHLICLVVGSSRCAFQNLVTLVYSVDIYEYSEYDHHGSGVYRLLQQSCSCCGHAL